MVQWICIHYAFTVHGVVGSKTCAQLSCTFHDNNIIKDMWLKPLYQNYVSHGVDELGNVHDIEYDSHIIVLQFPIPVCGILLCTMSHIFVVVIRASDACFESTTDLMYQ